MASIIVGTVNQFVLRQYPKPLAVHWITVRILSCHLFALISVQYCALEKAANKLSASRWCSAPHLLAIPIVFCLWCGFSWFGSLYTRLTTFRAAIFLFMSCVTGLWADQLSAHMVLPPHLLLAMTTLIILSIAVYSTITILLFLRLCDWTGNDYCV